MNYLADFSCSAGGPGPSPTPVCGSWSASIANQNGIFHPLNGTSAYSGLLRVGRKVRISVGGVYASADHLWQRIIGYMDPPKFDAVGKKVSLSGNDYTGPLANFQFKAPGNYWGSSQTFGAVTTTETYGANLYAGGDAADPDADGNNVTGWSVGGGNISSAHVSGGGSAYAVALEKTSSYSYAFGYINPGSLVKGTLYEVQFTYYVGDAGNTVDFTLANVPSGHVQGQILGLKKTGTWGAWATALFRFAASEGGTAQLKVRLNGSAGSSQFGYIDQIYIRPVLTMLNTRYAMPASCNEVYYVTLNGAPIWYGDTDNSWHFDDVTQMFDFDDTVYVTGGTANLVVYYMTTQTVEKVVADVLAKGPNDSGGGCGLYASEAAALAAMDFAATGVTVPLVWFEVGTTGLAAIQALCELVNYRFWFGWDGTPHFKPAPAVGSPVFALTSFGHVSEATHAMDLSVIANDIVIQGNSVGQFQTTNSKQTSQIQSEVSDAPSIASYMLVNLTISNSLFQDQAAMDAMAAVYLALYKDPKSFATITLPMNPVPLEIGDTVTWVLQFSPTQDAIGVTGIIRSINLNMGGATYVCEVASRNYAWVINEVNHGVEGSIAHKN